MFGFNFNKFVDKIQQQVPVAKLAVTTLVGGDAASAASSTSPPPSPPHSRPPTQQQQSRMGPPGGGGVGGKSPVPPIGGMSGSGSGFLQQQQQQPKPIPSSGSGMGFRGPSPGPSSAAGSPDRFSSRQQQTPSPRPTSMSPPPPHPSAAAPSSQQNDMMADMAGLSEEERQHIAAVLQRAQMEMEVMVEPPPSLPPVAKKPPHPPPTTTQTAQVPQPQSSSSATPIPTVTVQPTTPEVAQRLTTPGEQSFFQEPSPQHRQLPGNFSLEKQQQEPPSPIQRHFEPPPLIPPHEEEVHMDVLLEPSKEQRHLLFGSSEEDEEYHGYHPQLSSSSQPVEQQQQQQPIVLQQQRYDEGFSERNQMVVEGVEEDDQLPPMGEYDQQVPGDDSYKYGDMEETMEEPMLMEEQGDFDMNEMTSPYADEELQETPPPPSEGHEDEDLLRSQQHDAEVVDDDEQAVPFLMPRRSSSQHSQQNRFLEHNDVMDFRIGQQQIIIPLNDDYYYQTTNRSRSSVDGSASASLPVVQSQHSIERFQPADVDTEVTEVENEDFAFGSKLHHHESGAVTGDEEEEAGLELCPICRDTALDIDLDTSKVCADCERYVCKNCGSYEQQHNQQQPGALQLQTSAARGQWLCVECETRRQLELRRTLTEKWAVSSSQSKKDRRLTKAATISTELAHDMPQPHPVNFSQAGSSGAVSPSKQEVPHVRRQSLPDAFDLEQSDVENNMSTVQEILDEDNLREPGIRRRATIEHEGDDTDGGKFDIERSMSIGPSASEVVATAVPTSLLDDAFSAEQETDAQNVTSPEGHASIVDFSTTSGRSTFVQGAQRDVLEEPAAVDNLSTHSPSNGYPSGDEHVGYLEIPIEHDETALSTQQPEAFIEQEDTSFQRGQYPTTRVQEAQHQDQPVYDDEEYEEEPMPPPPQHQPLQQQQSSRSGRTTDESGSDVLIPETEFEYQEVRWYSKYSDENLQQSASGNGPNERQAASSVIPPLPMQSNLDTTADALKHQPGPNPFTFGSHIGEEIASDEPPREFGVVIRAPSSSSHSLTEVAAPVAPGEQPLDFSLALPSASSLPDSPRASQATTTADQAGATTMFPFQPPQQPSQVDYAASSSSPSAVLSTSLVLQPPPDLQQQWLQQFQGSTDFSYYPSAFSNIPPAQPPPPPPVPPRQSQQSSSGGQPVPMPSQTWPPASATPGLPSDLSPIMDVSPSIEEFEEELMIEQQKQMREAEEAEFGEEHEEDREIYFDEDDLKEIAPADHPNRMPTDQQQQQQLQQQMPPRFSEEELGTFYKCDDLSSSFSRLKKSPKFEFGLSDLVTQSAPNPTADSTPSAMASGDANAMPRSDSGDIQMESLGAFNITVKTSPQQQPSKNASQDASKHFYNATQPHDIVDDEDKRMELSIEESYEPNYESVHSISEDIVKSFSLDASAVSLPDDSLVSKNQRPIVQQTKQLQQSPKKQIQPQQPPQLVSSFGAQFAMPPKATTSSPSAAAVVVTAVPSPSPAPSVASIPVVNTTVQPQITSSSGGPLPVVADRITKTPPSVKPPLQLEQHVADSASSLSAPSSAEIAKSTTTNKAQPSPPPRPTPPSPARSTTQPAATIAPSGPIKPLPMVSTTTSSAVLPAATKPAVVELQKAATATKPEPPIAEPTKPKIAPASISPNKPAPTQPAATLPSQVERRDNFLRGTVDQPSPGSSSTSTKSQPPTKAPATSATSPKGAIKSPSPAAEPQPAPPASSSSAQQRVTFHMSPPTSAANNQQSDQTAAAEKQEPQQRPAVRTPAKKKNAAASIKESSPQPGAGESTKPPPPPSSSDESPPSLPTSSLLLLATATVSTSTATATSTTTTSITATSATSARSRARRKLPEVPQNAEPFSGVPGVTGAPISSLLQLAAFQRSTSPQQALLAGSSRTLPRSSRLASSSSLLVTDSSYRFGIKRSSSAGRGTINGDQSPERTTASLLIEANAAIAQTAAMSDRRVGFNLPGTRPLFINTAPTATQSHFRSRSLPQSPGSHVSPRFSGSPIRAPSPGNNATNIGGGDVNKQQQASSSGSPRLSAGSLPVGTPRFVHMHGVTVPAEIKDIKDQLNLEIRLATANRRRLLDELEIRRLERQLEEIRELERQQKASMQKRLAGDNTIRSMTGSMHSSPTLRSALQNKQQSSNSQMSVSFVQMPPKPPQPPQPRQLEPSRWPAQKYPLQKQHSDPALFSPVQEMYGDYGDQSPLPLVVGTGGGSGAGAGGRLSQDDATAGNRYSNYGTLPRGGIVSPSGRIIPLSKYRKGDTEYSSPPTRQPPSSQSGGAISDEIDAHVALLKDEICKRKEQIENTQILECELEKLTEEAKKRCEKLQCRIISTDQQLSAGPPSNVIPPLGAATGGPMPMTAKSNIIRPLAPESPMVPSYSSQPPPPPPTQSRLMTSPPYSNDEHFVSTMPQPVRMAPDFAQFHTGPLLRPQSIRRTTSPPSQGHMMPPPQNFPPGPPPGHMPGPFQPQPPQLPACAHCHSVYHHSHAPPPQPSQHPHMHHSPFTPPGFPPSNYEDFTSRSNQMAAMQHPGPMPIVGQRLAGSHAELGGFQDFATASRHVMCPHCSVHAGSTNHLLHHHPAGDFNHHSTSMQPPQRSVLSQQPIGQLIGRTTADGGRNDPSQLNAKRRTYPYPVKRILLTRDPRDKSVRSNGLGLRIVGGKQVPGAPEGELGAFVAQVFQGTVADQLHGEVKEGDQVLEWNGVSLGSRTFEDVLQIINQPCEEIEIVIKAGDSYNTSSSLPQFPRPHSQHSFYDNMETAGTAEFEPGAMTASSTGGDMFGDTPRSGGRRGVPYADERDIQSAMMRSGGSRQRIPSTGSTNRVNRQGRPDSSSSAELLNNPDMGLPIDQQQQGGPSSGEIQLALSFDEYERILTVEVLRARGLYTSDDHMPSPYVRLRLNPVKGQNCIQTSSQLYSTSNPEFHQAFGFPLSSVASLSRRTMDICLWDVIDADRKREKLIGETVISMANTSLLDGRPHWFRLRPPSPAGMTPIDVPTQSSTSTMNAIIHPQPQHPMQQQQPQMVPQPQQQQQQQQMQYQQMPQQIPQQQQQQVGNGGLNQNPYGMMNGGGNGTVQSGFKPQQQQQQPQQQMQQQTAEPSYSRQRHLTGGNTVGSMGNQPTPAHHRSVYFDDQIRCVDDYRDERNSMTQYR